MNIRVSKNNYTGPAFGMKGRVLSPDKLRPEVQKSFHDWINIIGETRKIGNRKPIDDSHVVTFESAKQGRDFLFKLLENEKEIGSERSFPSETGMQCAITNLLSRLV